MAQKGKDYGHRGNGVSASFPLSPKRFGTVAAQGRKKDEMLPLLGSAVEAGSVSFQENGPFRQFQNEWEPGYRPPSNDVPGGTCAPARIAETI